MTATSGRGAPAGPQLMRVLNEQLLLGHIRTAGELSRADLARITRLSKPTVSSALTNLERAGLVRMSRMRTGLPGPAATLYEVRPEAGYVLGLDVGAEFLRGAICDLSGEVRARATVKTHSATRHSRVAKLVTLADKLCAEVGLTVSDLTQTVLGSPGVYDPGRDALALAGAIPGWDEPLVLTELRAAFTDALMLENDIDAAALAEQAHGHGRDVDNFAFVSVGTGIGMGLVLNGRLHRGAHGAAGEIGFLPLDNGESTDAKDARKRGSLEAAASAAGVVYAARRAGIRRPISARHVFDAAASGDERAIKVVADEAVLIAKAICSVIAVADPGLVVLGGGIGQADGLLDTIDRELRKLAPVLPELRVSALGADSVVDGCLAAGIERAWELVTVDAHAGTMPAESSS